MFVLKNRPGALYRFLKPIAQRGLNLTKIESRPSKKQAWDYVFFVDKEGHSEDAILRETINELKNEESFFYGWNPPHPTFFVKRKIYNKYGLYNQKLGNPADIELMFRYLYQKKINYRYINKFLILMRYGGESNKSFLNIVNQNIKILSILKIEKNLFKVICFIYGKLINRLSQFIK